MAALLAAQPDVVSIDRLVDITWADEPPARAEHNIRTYISRLRTVLGAEATLQQVGDGYRITLLDAGCDLDRFDELVDAAERLRAAGSTADALEAVRRSEELWRGQPFGEFAFEPWARADVARLEERHHIAREIHAELLLLVGRPADAVTRLQALVAEHPLREPPRALLMRSLYACGRTAEALREFDDFRTDLRDEVGLAPSSELIELDHAIANGDLVDHAVTAKVGGYALHERIGAGAFAVVHRATQKALSREVAVKIIRAELATQPSFVRSFEREARIVARLERDAIVPLYDFWRDPDHAYLVMRYLPGGSLSDRLEDGPLSLDEVEALVERVGSALVAAHEAGVIHRDVKPANILFDADGRAVLGDFGIAVEDSTSGLGSEPQASESSNRFAAPEQLQDERPGPSVDVYSLGLVVWSALAGRVPFASSSSDAVVEQKMAGGEGLEPIGSLRPDLPDALVEVIDAATNPDPSRRPPSMKRLVGRIRAASSSPVSDQVENGPQAVREPGVNPYQGLRSFDEATSRHFYGRSDLVDELVDAVSQPNERLLTVVGASGSGKSSVVRAGLLPALRSGAVEGSEDWFVTSMTPGSHPFEALETAVLRVAVNPPGELLTQLTSGDRGLIRSVERLLPERDGSLLLIIDQFEELFTSTDPATANRFLDALSIALTEPNGRLRVVATLRGDFYDRPLRHLRFAQLLKESTVAVTPLSPEELEAVILQPAQSVGADFEPGLVARIMSDTADQPGSLALLEYALTLAFDRSDGRTITAADYSKIGGLQGAMVGQAEQLHDRLDPQGRNALRRVMGSLVSLGEGTEDTRRRALRAELGTSPEVSEVIDLFSAARLFTLDHDPATRAPTVEVAHESLIRSWPRVRDWLDEDRDGLRLERHLSEAAREWDAAGRPDSELYRGGRLEAASEWRMRSKSELGPGSDAFLEASVARAEAKQRAETERLESEQQSNRRLRRLLTSVGVLLAFALVAGGIAFQQRRSARETAYDAETSRLVATAKSLVDTDSRAALLLALAAHQRERTPETLGALQVALTRSGPGLATLGDGVTYVDVEWLDNGLIVGARADGLDLFDPASGELLDSWPLGFGDNGEGDRHRMAALSAGEFVVAHDTVRVSVFSADQQIQEQRNLPLAESPVITVSVGPAGQIVTSTLGGVLTAYQTDGSVGFVKQFDLPANIVEQAIPFVGSESEFLEFFRAFPVLVVPFAVPQGMLVSVGSELHRLDWTGAALARPSFTAIDFSVTAGRPVPPFLTGGAVDVFADGTRLLVLGVNTLVDLDWNDEWDDLLVATSIPSAFGNGQANASAIRGVSGDEVRVVKSDGEVRTVNLVTGEDSLADNAPAAAARILSGAPDSANYVSVAESGLRVISPFGATPIAEGLDRASTSSNLSISPDGDVVAMGPSGYIAPYDVRQRTSSGRFEKVVLGEEDGVFVGVDPGSATLRTFSEASRVVFYSLDGGITASSTWDQSPGGNVGHESQDGRLLAVGYNVLEVWEIGADAPLVTRSAPDGSSGVPLSGIRFDPSRNRLLAAWADGQSMLLDTTSWEQISVPALQMNETAVGFWSRDGSLLATASPDGVVTVRRGDTMEPIRTLVGSLALGTAYFDGGLLFSTDNRLLLTNLAGSGRLWDIETGEQIGDPFPNLNGVNPGVNVGTNGLQLITGTERGALIWNLDTDSWPGIACQVVDSNLSEHEWVQWGPRDEPYREICP